MAKKKKPTPDFTIDFNKYVKRIKKRLAKPETAITPADVVAMALPDIMSKAGYLLRHLSETEKDLDYDTASDDAGIVVYSSEH